MRKLTAKVIEDCRISYVLDGLSMEDIAVHQDVDYGELKSIAVKYDWIKQRQDKLLKKPDAELPQEIIVSQGMVSTKAAKALARILDQTLKHLEYDHTSVKELKDLTHIIKMTSDMMQMVFDAAAGKTEASKDDNMINLIQRALERVKAGEGEIEVDK